MGWKDGEETALAELDRVARVLVMQPESLCRAGLCRLLQDYPDLDVIAAEGEVAPALAVARTAAPDLVLTEVDLPDGQGPAFLRALSALPRPPAVVVVSRQRGHAHIAGAMELGAHAYLPRDSRPEQVAEALRSAARGEKYLHPLLAAGLVEGALRPGPGRLTGRELALLLYLARGASNEEIASDLYISEKTVRNSLTRLFAKLHARNRLEAVSLARQRGLV